jgi:hypothetical protein
MKKIEFNMRQLRIEDDFFKIRIYKDQNQFRIKHADQLVERLLDIDKLTHYHEKEKKKPKEPEIPQAKHHIEDTTERFEHAFNRFYKLEHNMTQYAISNMLGQDDYEEIKAKHMLYEILHQSKANLAPILMMAMLIAAF